MVTIDVVYREMIWIEFGIVQIETIIRRFISWGNRYWILEKFSCISICMRILRRKVFSCMAVKIEIILIFVDKCLSFYGKTCLILTTINAILVSKQEDREHRGWIFGNRWVLTIAILWNILFVDRSKIKFILLSKIIVKQAKN
jgi:hypothetical protein